MKSASWFASLAGLALVLSALASGMILPLALCAGVGLGCYFTLVGWIGDGPMSKWGAVLCGLFPIIGVPLLVGGAIGYLRK